jgi:hypothetical protein
MAGGEQRKYYVDELRGLLASAQIKLGRVRTERDEACVGRDVAETELARRRAGDSGSTSKGPVIVWGGEEEEEECATAASSSFAAEREGWERRIVDVESERDTWTARHDRSIAANLKLMATIELLARDSDRWQTECAASAKRASEVVNKRDGSAREVDVGMSTLADVRGSAKPARPSARGFGTRTRRSRRRRGGLGRRSRPCGGGYGRPRFKGGGGVRGERRPAGRERRVGANFITR